MPDATLRLGDVLFHVHIRPGLVPEGDVYLFASPYAAAGRPHMVVASEAIARDVAARPERYALIRMPPTPAAD